VEKIAQGGMGAIYKAQDQRLQGKIVAVKEMAESAIATTERQRVLESFRREAELLARLEHPNLVRVTDCFQEEQRHYMVMEFIEGKTLKSILAGCTDPFPEERVLAWASQLCDVLSYLHSQEPKIIYRDVKPANVMVLDGTDTAKLIDFGIARFFKPGKRKDTIEFGTYGYAPPEQYGQSQTDERADVYALGALLHQLLTLRNPTVGLFRFPPVCRLNPRVSRRVEAAIAKAVEANKDKRHQSMEELWEALLGERPTGRQPTAQTNPTVKKPAPAAQSATPSPAPGPLTTAPLAMDFAQVMISGEAPDRSLVVNLPVDEQAVLDTDTPWLQVHPRSINKSGSQVIVTLDTARLQPGRLQLQGGWLKRWVGWPARFLVPAQQEVQAHVEIESKSGHRQRVPVSVTVVPRTWQVQVGWIVAIGAILLEVAVVVGALGILAMTIVLGTGF
jgi:serine/threonine protein kinase